MRAGIESLKFDAHWLLLLNPTGIGFDLPEVCFWAHALSAASSKNGIGPGPINAKQPEVIFS